MDAQLLGKRGGARVGALPVVLLLYGLEWLRNSMGSVAVLKWVLYLLFSCFMA